LIAAVEGVPDAAPTALRRQFAQVLEQLVGRTPHMQDDRQPMLARQLELLAVEKFLALTHRAFKQRGHKIIQPDLTHRHQARVATPERELFIQRLQVGVLRLGHTQRVNAQRIAV
jgi:hypothetical protein